MVIRTFQFCLAFVAIVNEIKIDERRELKSATTTTTTEMEEILKNGTINCYLYSFVRRFTDID